MPMRQTLYAVCTVCLLLAPVTGAAQTGFVLPEPVPLPRAAAAAPKNFPEGTPVMIPMPSVRLSMGIIDFPAVRGVPLERPQALTVLRHRLEDIDEPSPPASDPEQPASTEVPPVKSEITTERSEHLSAVEETTVYDAPGWTTEVALPHSGVYQFILETKPVWTPAVNRFVQHTAKTLYSGQDGTVLWEHPAGLDFEIVPMTRPLGLCSGMSFSGQVLLQGKPVGGALVEAAWLPPDTAAKNKKNAAPALTPLQEVRTSADGVFTMALPWDGWWGFSALTSGGDPLRAPDGTLRPVDLKTTLWVRPVPCASGSGRAS